MNTVSHPDGERSGPRPVAAGACLFLAICSMSLPDRRPGRHHRQRCPAIHRPFLPTPRCPAWQWTVDAYTLVLASLPHAVGLSCGPARAPPRLSAPGWSCSRRGRLAWRAGSRPRAAGRLPGAPGDRRRDAQPVHHGDRAQHVHRPPRAGRRPSACSRRCSASRWRSGRVLGRVPGLGRSPGGPVFVVNLPVGLAAIVLAARFRGPSPWPRGPRGLDPAGPGPGDRGAGRALPTRVIERRTGRLRHGPRIVIVAGPVAPRMLRRPGCPGSYAGVSRCWRCASSPAPPFAPGPAPSPSALSAALGGFLFHEQRFTFRDVRGPDGAATPGLCMPAPPRAMMIVFAPVSRAPDRPFRAPARLCAPGAWRRWPAALMLTGPRPGDSAAVPPRRLRSVRPRPSHSSAPPIASTAVSGMPPAQSRRGLPRWRRPAVRSASRWAWPCSGVVGRRRPRRTDRPRVSRTATSPWVVDRGRSRAHGSAALGYLTTTGWARGTARPNSAAPGRARPRQTQEADDGKRPPRAG